MESAYLNTTVNGRFGYHISVLSVGFSINRRNRIAAE